jgi:hypothetical protein
MRARKRLNEQERRDLMTRQASLTALTKHPSWPDFENEVGMKVERIERAIVSRVLLSRDPIDEQEILYWRGFVHGLRWLVAAPTGAEARLEHFLREQATEEAA